MHASCQLISHPRSTHTCMDARMTGHEVSITAGADTNRAPVNPDLTTIEIILVVAVTAAGAIVQGSVGIGLGLVASPVLLAIDASFAPGPLLVAGLVIGVRHIGTEWDHLDRGGLGRALIGLPVGAGAALTILALMAPSTLSLMIGILICVAAVVLMAGVELRRTPKSDVVTGACCAFTSLAAALPGPPLVIGFNNLSPSSLRCTVSVFVAAVSAVAVVSLASIGRFGRDEVALLLLMVPGLLGGLLLSRWTRPWLDRSWFRPAVLTIAFIGGAGLAGSQMV